MCGGLQEISQFVAANWVELQDFETGSKYFYNQITHRTQFDKPVQPQKVRSPSLHASPQNRTCMRCDCGGPKQGLRSPM